MPAMPRRNNKATRLAFEIIGVPLSLKGHYRKPSKKQPAYDTSYMGYMTGLNK